MGKQSARIFFRGKDHKEIYYQGHYHNAMYIGSTLVWEKLKTEQPSGTPLDGFSAICYYNGFYYVVNCETKSTGKVSGDTLEISIYQGESLDSLEFAYIISSTKFAYTPPVLVTADKNGLTLAYYEVNNTSSRLYYVYHFKYLENKKIDIESVGKGYDHVISAIHIPGKKYICFLKDFYLGHSVNEKLSSDAELLYIQKDIFFWNNKIICPLTYTGGYQLISEPYYTYFGTDSYNDGARSNILSEIRRIKIPGTICSKMYDVVKAAAAKDYYDNVTSENVYIKCEGAGKSHCYVSDKYMLVPCIEISAGCKINNNYYYQCKRYFRCVIDLENFEFVFLEECKIDYEIYYLSFILDKYIIGLKKSSGINYAWWDYDGSYNHKTINFYDIENVNEIEDLVSASGAIRISSCYYLNKNIYVSIYLIDNYLLQIDTVNNTASVIKPQLYLEEE